MNSIEFRTKAKQLRQTLDRLEALTTEPTSSLTKYLCLLAENHPNQLSFDTLSYELDRSPSHIGRMTRTLHKLRADKTPGLDLVEVEFDLESPKSKLVKLNAKGQRALTQILDKP